MVGELSGPEKGFDSASSYLNTRHQRDKRDLVKETLWTWTSGWNGRVKREKEKVESEKLKGERRSPKNKENN